MYPIMVQWGQAKVIKLFILMDVDTQTQTTTCTCTPTPFLPLWPHTFPDSKAHKHTSWAGGQQGRKSIFEELKLPGLVVKIPLSLQANYRVFCNAALSLLSLRVPVGSNMSSHLLIPLLFALTNYLRSGQPTKSIGDVFCSCTKTFLIWLTPTALSDEFKYHAFTIATLHVQRMFLWIYYDMDVI